MPNLTAAELFDLAGIIVSGVTHWDQLVPSRASGVYVITVPNAATVTFLEQPDSDEDRARWVGDQDIVYVGRASVLSRRLRQFAKHVYGARFIAAVRPFCFSTLRRRLTGRRSRFMGMPSIDCSPLSSGRSAACPSAIECGLRR